MLHHFFPSRLLVLLWLLLSATALQAQYEPYPPEFIITPADYSGQIEALEQDFAANKQLDSTYYLQSLIALSYYPELRPAQIEFVQQPIFTTMACRPRLDFFLKRRSKRVYRILINNDTANSKAVLLGDVTFNAQVGVIGHELAHVVDYSQKNVFGVIFTGIGYLFKPYRRRLEHRIDRIGIEHGLGWQIYDYAGQILKSDSPRAYKQYKREIYYLPSELLQIITESDN